MYVQLHRNTTKLRKVCLSWALLGALGWVGAWLVEAKPDHLHHNKASFYEVVGVVMVAASLVAWLMLLWPFLIEVDDDGLTVRLRGVTTRLPWESVEALTVTKVGDSWKMPNLDVRLAPGVKLRGRLASKRDGRRVYTLLAMDDFTIAAEEVIAVLQRYGGGRVDAEQYLQHLSARRYVAQFMAEYRADQRRIEAEKAAARRASKGPRRR
jgi:hypothetical protein